MGNKMSIRQWVECFERGEFDAKDVHTQMKAGWYDWFCKNESLARRTGKLASVVLYISKSPRINVDTMYVFFKNNCPCSGGTYDSVSVCDMATGDVLYWIAPNDRNDGCTICEVQKDGAGNMVEHTADTWREARGFFQREAYDKVVLLDERELNVTC